MKDYSRIRILAFVVFLGGLIGWSGGAAADWYVSHFAPGQAIGEQPVERMMVVDDDGLIHLYYAGHALTHAIVDGGDVTFEAITEPGVGYGSLDVTSDPTLGTLISWFDPDRRRRHIVYGETGDWIDRVAQEDMLADDAWLHTLIDAEGLPLTLATARLSHPLSSFYDLWSDPLSGSTPVYQEGDWAIGGMTALSDGHVAIARTNSDNSYLGDWDGITLNWTPAPALNEYRYGILVRDQFRMWDRGGEPGVAAAYEDHFEPLCYHIAVAFPESSDSTQELRVADPLWNSLYDFDVLPNEGDGFSLVYSDENNVAWIDHDGAGNALTGSVVLNLQPYTSGSEKKIVGVDAARDILGRRIVAVVPGEELRLLRETESGWTQQTIDRSRRVAGGGLWVDPSTAPATVEILSLQWDPEERLRLDRFDGAWTTRIWPHPVPNLGDFDSQIWAAHDANNWFVLYFYNNGMDVTWRSDVFRYDDDTHTWVDLNLPAIFSNWDVRRMKKGGDGRVWVGGQGGGGYAVATYTDAGWLTRSTTDDFALDAPMFGDFTVDENGGIHVAYPLQIGGNLRYVFFSPVTGHWTRETIPDPDGHCPVDGNLSIVTGPAGEMPVVACLDNRPAEYNPVDEGEFALFVREPSGWVLREVWNDLWNAFGYQREVTGAYNEGYVFALERRGDLTYLRFDGTDWTSESVPGAVGSRGLRMIYDGEGGLYTIFDTPGGVGLVYPSDAGPVMARDWAPGAAEASVVVTPADAVMVWPDCDSWEDDDGWWDDDGDDDDDNTGDDDDDADDDDTGDDDADPDDDDDPDLDAHADEPSGDDDDDGCGC